MSRYQGTVTKVIHFVGVGLHSGKLVELAIAPAQPNTGIVFKRTDTTQAQPIKAHPFNVASTNLCTAIGEGESRVSTIEHLMAAFYGLGIDNALVSVSADEIPILDGSSAPFVDKLREAGIQIQSIKRNKMVIRRKVEIARGNQLIRLEPAAQLEFHCMIDFPESKAIGEQSISIKFNQETFMTLCESRTFCHVKDVESMRAMGLARGGSLDNAIVVNHEEVINNDGLRSEDEFVRHKLLDCIGDLALLGCELVAKVTLIRAGHALHNAMTKKLLESDSGILTIVHHGDTQDAPAVKRPIVSIAHG